MTKVFETYQMTPHRAVAFALVCIEDVAQRHKPEDGAGGFTDLQMEASQAAKFIRQHWGTWPTTEDK